MGIESLHQAKQTLCSTDADLQVGVKQPARPSHGCGNGVREWEREIQVPHRQLKVGKNNLRVLVLREVGAVEGADELGKLPFGEELVLRLPAFGKGVGKP